MSVKAQTGSGNTSLVGLIGWPIGHSLSPLMHNAAFQALDLDWLYLPLPVRPGEVGAALKGLAALNFAGCNVTVPHKETALEHLDQIDHVAKVLGAANTISIKNGMSAGANTDPAGFLLDLQEQGIDPKGMDAVVLGAGGAARGILYALAQAQVNSVIVINRTIGRAEALVQDMFSLFSAGTLGAKPLTREAFEALGQKVDLVINTTPVGMAPKEGDCPWPKNVPMPEKTTYYDLVYNPKETVFLTRARAAGAVAVGGLGMLIYQGALSFNIWTGQQAPIEVMRQVCERGYY
jgi:shikimate dehydrogenase